ncbi:MAG: PA14 domain-containing protein [Anaerolineales bacterium]
MKSSKNSRFWFYILLTAAMFIGLAGCSALVSLGLMDPPPQTDRATPTDEAVSTALIAGRVWQDRCAEGEGCLRASDGSFRPNGLEDAGEPGLEGVTLELGLGACPITGFAETVSGANGTYVFGALSTGTYCLSIDPSRNGNAEILGSAPWTHPAYGQGVSRITITLQQPGETRLVSFGRQATTSIENPTPTVTAPPADGPTATPAPQGCLNWVEFVSDVTIADTTRIGANKSFDKTWRLRNAGTCTWTTEYDLVFVSGNRMQGPSAKNLPRSVAPGDTVDLTVRLKAPEDTGLYRGYWMLQSEQNQLFGLGTRANSPFWVQIIVGPLGTTSSGSWRGEYFARRDLKGTAGFVRNDPVIDFDWDDRSPGSPLGSDNFSVRWTGKSQFEAGTYRFTLRVDDGARLWVDDELVIDSWKDGSDRKLEADVALARGSHDIRLEYYERSGDARIRLSWAEVESPTFSHWKAQFWTNRDFSGSPALVRNDRDINFDWDDGSPAVGIPENNFSARWTREITFNAGTYRFNVQADDGVRLWVGDDRLINEWHDSSGSQIYQALVTLSGKQRIKVEHYERSGDARIRVWWEKVDPTATPTTEGPTPTPTATATDEPPPTDTPEPTNTPEPTATTPPAPQELVSLAETACSAEWRNESSLLSCPGQSGEAEGAVYIVNNPSTEAGSTSDSLGLVTEPEQISLGFIQGTYPAVTLQSGDRLVASIGCMDGQPSCSVEFEVLLRIGDQNISLGSWNETSDGTMRSIELDLSAYAGQSVAPVLLVRNDTSSSLNSAVWLNPRILR